MNDQGKYIKVKSVLDIAVGYSSMGTTCTGSQGRSKSSQVASRSTRTSLPELTNHLFDGIFPADNVITVVQKSYGVHKIHMREVAAWVLNGTHWFSLLQQPMMIIVWCHNWEDASKFQYLMQILQAHFHDFVPRYQIFMFDDSKIYGSIPQWQEPTTLWDGKPVLGFMAETFLDDLSVIGFKDFNPMWSFPTTSVNQCWDPMTFGMPPWHVGEDAELNRQRSKEALQSQSPIAAFKACNMLQALGIAYSKIVLPSGDSKGEAKQRTYCPTTWTHCYQWTYAAQYADLLRQADASPLLCKECTLLVRIQLSKKSPSHPECAFADCASTTMCGAMISLTPCIASTVPRQCDLNASISFKDADDMIQQLNTVLSKAKDFPLIPDPRQDCHVFHAKPDERHKQMVICPEQDCEWLAYMSDLNTSMVEALGVQDLPLWSARVQEFKEWQKKAYKGSKSSQEAWTWEGSSSDKWSTTSTRGSSKRGQSVPVDLSKRTNPEEKGLAWRDLEELDTSTDFLFPETSLPCPVEKTTPLPSAQQDMYIHWICRSFAFDHKTNKDPRIYCAYCDMNNHPRFACKHVEKHKKPHERHHCTLCSGRHPPFLCPRAQVNGGPGQPNWYKQEYKRAKSENRPADYRWGEQVTHVEVDGPDSSAPPPPEVQQPQCAAAAMMHGISMAPASSLHGGCPPIAENQEYSQPMAPPGMVMMQREVITPNPDYPIPANLWDLNIPHCARAPSPLSTFIRHCNTMQSPHFPTYSKQGVSEPVAEITDLNRSTSSIENLRELQKYSEKLSYESTCCRLWAEGIQTQIKDEQERVHKWIEGMTEDLLRLKRTQYAQPHWMAPMINPLQPSPPNVPSQPASSSSASMVPVKPAPLNRNPSMAGAPMNASFPSSMGMDPWAEAKMKHQR